jgi:hypothetical protein
MGHKRRASILVAFAHLDDEIFHGGILAHLAERGARVTLVCATDGEAGKAHPSVEPVDDLGAARLGTPSFVRTTRGSMNRCCCDSTTGRAKSGSAEGTSTPVSAR